MTAKTLLFILLLSLAACSTAPQQPVQAKKPEKPAKQQKVQSRVIRPAPLPLYSRKYLIMKAAMNEWLYFGQQKVVINGNEESIPHVGIWEDDDSSHSSRINQYWRAVGKSRVSGTDCSEPWSAAFISWIMQAAGVPDYVFPPSASHRSYLNHFLANAYDPGATLIPHTIQRYKPKPGDLICATRGNHTPSSMVYELPDSLNNKMHCDIVVETKGQTLEAIGGNVRNSVSKTILTLSPQGYLQMTKSRPWSLIIENRLN